MKTEKTAREKNRRFIKPIAAGLALLLALSLSGCGADKKNGTEPPSPSSELTAPQEETPSLPDEQQSEPDASEIAATAETKEFVFEDLLLSLIGHFDVADGTDVGPAQYTDPYFGTLCVRRTENGKVGENPPQGAFFTELTNDEAGNVEMYKTDDGYAAEFAVGPDVYALRFSVNAEKGVQPEDAEYWFINTLTQLKLTADGKRKAQGAGGGPAGPVLAEGDSETLQAFFMPTFRALTGTTPKAFTASAPQPYTVYLIADGDGYTDNHRLIAYDEATEAEYSERYTDSLNMLRELLEAEGHTLVYASDPHRASIILVVERKYEKSAREYTNLTAYDCKYTITAINTKTHASESFSSVTKPDYVLRNVPVTMRNYYCDATYDPYDFKDFLKGIAEWLN